MPYYAYIAYTSVLATVVTFVTGLLFFLASDRLGKANDISSVFQVLIMLPLAIMFAQRFSQPVAALGVVAAVLGGCGMLISAVGQSLLVFNKIDFDRSRDFFPAGALIGIWLLMVSILHGADGQLLPLVIWSGLVSGVAYIGTVVGFMWGGQKNVLFAVSGGLLGISYPVWAIALGNQII